MALAGIETDEQVVSANGDSAAPRPKASGYFVVTVLASLAGLPSLLYPFGKDQALFATIAQRWLAGGRPYVATFDVKPPGVFAVYALAQSIVGQTMLAIRVVDLLAVCLSSAGLYYLGARRSNFAGMAAGIVYGLAYFGDFDYWHTAQPESFAIPCIIWAVCALTSVMKGRHLLAGVLIGTAALMKTPFLALILLIPAIERVTLRQAGEVLAGLAVPVTITVGYFGVATMAELLAFQRGHASGQMDGIAARLLGVGGLFTSSHPLVVVIAATVAVGLFVPRKGTAFGWIWLGLSLVVVLVQGRLYSYHFLAALPPLVLLFGWTLEKLPRLAMAGVCVVVAAFASIALPRYGVAIQYLRGQVSQDTYWRTFTVPSDYSIADSALVASYVRDSTDSSDKILELGYDPAIYFLSQRAPCSRQLTTTPFAFSTGVPAALRQRWYDELTQDVAQIPPELLILENNPAANWDASPVPINLTRVEFGNHSFNFVKRIGKFYIYRRYSSRLEHEAKYGGR